MYFSSFSELISMNGHGIYVWTCYAIAVAVIVFNILSPRMKSRAFFQEQARQIRREKRQAKSDTPQE